MCRVNEPKLSLTNESKLNLYVSLGKIPMLAACEIKKN